MFERYGGSIIKRYYIRQGSLSYTNVDSKLKPVCIKMLNSNDLINGKIHKNMLKTWWTQLGKNAQIKELKSRILDHLNAAGYPIDSDDLRLWMYTNNQTERGEDIK